MERTGSAVGVGIGSSGGIGVRAGRGVGDGVGDGVGVGVAVGAGVGDGVAGLPVIAATAPAGGWVPPTAISPDATSTPLRASIAAIARNGSGGRGRVIE